MVGVRLPNGLDVPQLAGLEDRWFDVLAAGTALQHGDLRADNVVREPGGRLRLVDWTHRWTVPGWADLVRLGPDLLANGGHDPQAFVLRERAFARVTAPAHTIYEPAAMSRRSRPDIRSYTVDNAVNTWLAY